MKPTYSSEKIAILGAGAIGQLVFHQLSRLTQGVALILRPDVTTSTHSSKSTKELEPELTFLPLSGEAEQHQARLIQADDKAALKELDLIIVCVKAYQVQGALTPLLAHLKTSCHLLLLHNGLGPHLELTPLLEGKGLHLGLNLGLSLGTTSQGAIKQAPWQVKQTGTGLTQLGHHAGTEMSASLKQLLLHAIPDSQWCSPILPMLWQKLAVNIAINPLTAILNSRNGELAKPQYRKLILALLDEVVTVAKHEGIELEKAALTERVFSVIKLTANNFSSMHQDIHHGRKTEIDAINGYLIKRAKSYGLSTPKNEEIVNKIIVLESKATAD
ncbi:2-dehydropantoate 2-reductase [Shewanella sp. AS1]|uniref:ketopantoate reductase family protein n=1 Tax=Shewanella sp. AS1 TaxID=2907626 RepID=UPI001F3484E4|nr:2-dehydropantoate 2-reductase [Shewanella sp. AS1]MCE9677951.1 2-dehydropantoate 2-reductase [Shewanella sp. AS1]